MDKGVLLEGSLNSVRKEKDRKEREEICSQYEQTIHPVSCASLTKPVNQTTVNEHSSKGVWPCC